MLTLFLRFFHIIYYSVPHLTQENITLLLIPTKYFICINMETIMKSAIKVFALLSICSLLAACAGVQQRQPLTKQNRTKIKSDKAILNTTQRQIVMQHNDWFNSNVVDPYALMDSGAIVHHNAGYQPGGGLITALVVAGIKHHEASNAITAMAPIQNTLADFNYVRYFNAQLRRKVYDIPWLKIHSHQIRYNIQQSQADILAATKDNAVLFIGMTYALNSVFNQLEVVTYVKLVDKASKKQTTQTLYANNFYFIYRLNYNTLHKEINKKVWLENNGEFLKNKLREAGALLSSMIATDLSEPSENPYSKIKNQVMLRTVNGAKVYGKVIKKQQGYYIVTLTRNGYMNGYIYIVNSKDLVA